MCGLYTIRTYKSDLLDGIDLLEWKRKTRYRVMPGTDALVLRASADGVSADMLRWGFRPSWLQEPGKAQINARSETVSTRPMFGRAYRQSRCLVLADGFYEPLKDSKPRRYFWFHKPDDALFAFAGIWTRFDEQGPEGTAYESFAILTTAPNTTVAPIHDRMPVILERGFHERWLDPEFRDAHALNGVIRPTSSRTLEGWEVTPRLYKNQDGPDLLRRI